MPYAMLRDSKRRKRLRRIECPQHVRFLTFSCYQRLPLFQNDAIKDAFALHIKHVCERLQVRLISWVIMPEHVHFMLVPALPAHPVPAILRDLKGGFANLVLARWRKLKAPILDRLVDAENKCRFWQAGGGYDRNIVTTEEYVEKLNYTHQNPIRRGLVELASEYRWSSARVYEGKQCCFGIPIDPIVLG